MSKNNPEMEKCKHQPESPLQINKAWMEQAFKEGGMPRSLRKESQLLYDGDGKGYKHCLCCGAKFYPTAGHELDQCYCKCPECRKARDNLRHRVRYCRLMSSEETRLAECARQKAYREARKQREGGVAPDKAGRQRRNSVRRMKAEINEKLNAIQLCMMGFIRSLGYPTKEDVDETYSRFCSLGSELQIPSAPVVPRTIFPDG